MKTYYVVISGKGSCKRLPARFTSKAAANKFSKSLDLYYNEISWVDFYWKGEANVSTLQQVRARTTPQAQGP